MNDWCIKQGFTLELKITAPSWQVTACYMQINLFSSMTELCNFLPLERQPTSSMFLENMHNLYILSYSSLTKTVVTRCSSSFLVHLATIFYELNLRRLWLRLVEAVIYIIWYYKVSALDVLRNLNFKYEWAYLAIGNFEIDCNLFSKLTLRI